MTAASISAERNFESFNPICDHRVIKINRLTAELIMLCEGLKQVEPRLAAVAQTRYGQAAMWALKAAMSTARVERAVKERVEHDEGEIA